MRGPRRRSCLWNEHPRGRLIIPLRRLYAEHGQISGVLIDQSDALPSANMYGIRFGSLRRAYALIGYQTNFDHKRAEVNARLRAMYPDIVQDTLTQIEAIGGAVTQVPKTGLSQKYVRYIVFLLEKGEERLIEAVQHGILPLSAAIQIARAKTDDDDLGDMLEEAYQSGERKTTQLHEAKQLLAKRRDQGPKAKNRPKLCAFARKNLPARSGKAA